MSGISYLMIGLAAGAAIGGALGWALARARHGSRAVALEGRLGEVRAQLEARAAESAAMRAELDSMRSARAEAAARLEEAERGVERQREMLDKMERGLGETFKSASMDALSRNTEEFLKYAEKALNAQKELGSKDLSGKKELIDQSLEGMTRKLLDVQRKIEEIGQGNMEKIGEVSIGIKHQVEATARLAETAEGLRLTLANTKKRGDWGERMAEDVIRLVGMVENINYVKQTTLEHDAGRPDFTFLLPGDLKINMDVKFPFDNYMNYLTAETDSDRKRFSDQVVKDVRKMISDVSKREYINKTTVDYVLVFIPNEQVYGFINEADTTLMDAALKQKVILCSPFTLYAVLAVIRQAMENFNLERTASEILKLLGAFSKQWDMFKDRMDAMGKRIEDAQKEYNILITTRTNMLERPLRKIEELRSEKAIPLPESLDLD